MSIVDNGDGTYTVTFSEPVTVTGTSLPEAAILIIDPAFGSVPEALQWNTPGTSAVQIGTIVTLDPGGGPAMVVGPFSQATVPSGDGLTYPVLNIPVT